MIGTLTLCDINIEEKASFLEYIFGGCQIEFSIAIDFTLSNGHPNTCESLHYFDLELNHYV